MKNTTLIMLSSLAGILFLNGCGLDRLFMDESNLENVSKYYYRPGKTNALPDSISYKFISEKSKAQMSLDEWIKICGNDHTNFVKFIKILGEKEQAGQMYAIVSVSNTGPGKNGKIGNYVFSRTWILENGKWRRLLFPKTAEKVYKSFKDGDYANAKTEAEEWLSVDPYSVEAYGKLGEAIEEIGGFNKAGRSKNDILRAMLSINPEDTMVLFDAVRWSETPSIAKSYLNKLEGTVAYSEAASNYALSIRNMYSRLKFLEGLEALPDIAILKLQSIASLILDGNKNYSWEDFKKVADTEGQFVKVKANLDESDSSYAAGKAGMLGMCFYESHDKTTAQMYLDYGISRDPNNDDIKLLASMLHPQ